MLCFIFSVAVVFLWESFILLINWHWIRLKIWNIFRWLIIKIRIVKKIHWYYCWLEISSADWLKIHEYKFSIKMLIFHDLDKFLLADNNDRLRNVNLHLYINSLSSSQQDAVFNLTADHCMMNNFCNIDVSRNLILYILTNVFKFRKLF